MAQEERRDNIRLRCGGRRHTPASDPEPLASLGRNRSLSAKSILPDAYRMRVASSKGILHQWNGAQQGGVRPERRTPQRHFASWSPRMHIDVFLKAWQNLVRALEHR